MKKCGNCGFYTHAFCDDHEGMCKATGWFTLADAECSLPVVHGSCGATSINDAVKNFFGITDNQSDAVNHPEHYTQGGIECIDAIKAATVELEGIEAFCTGNAIKYLFRWKRKNGAEDIRKAIWYCERLLKEIENESEDKEP